MKKDSADGDHRTPDTYKTASPRRHSLALESCWENAAIINGLVSPINERLERHTRIANLQPQELDLDKAMPIYESVQPYYEPYIATTPELVDDFFPFYQSTDIQCLDQDAWTQSGLIFPADERGGVVDCTPSKAQPQIRSSEEGRKPLGVETTSKDQEHDEDAGMNHTISHKRKFQTPEESGEDIGLDKRRKISHQNIHLDSKSYLEPAHFSPKADGADCTRNESHDLADVRAWLLDGRNVSIFEAESPDPAAIRAGLEDGRNVDFIEEKSPDLAETRA